MDYLPIFLHINGHKVVVDGGTNVAARRAERAVEAGAHVMVFDAAPVEDLTRLASEGRIQLMARPVKQADLEGARVVWGASEDEARDQQLRQWCENHGILCNIADQPEACDFITPTIINRGPLNVAISSGGRAPVISRIVKARIEAWLPPKFGDLALFVSGFRDRIAQTFDNGQERRRFWEKMIDGPAGGLFLSGQADAATARILADLEAEKTRTAPQKGEVYLVGAGPGNADLLTFRALRLMQQADVVLYDRLLGDEILSLVRRDADRIYVGKRKNDHTMAQEDITAKLIELAQQGLRVLRLKGGDPFIFGRGGEEIQGLARAGIPFQVVPGVTAAAGCGAYAGIPLTHRDHAQTALFVTAHGKNGVLNLDWDVLTRPGQTVAIYMGLGALPTLVAGLRKHKTAPTMPVALIENGTRPNQRVIVGTLETIEDKVEQAKLKGPTMIIIGSVVTLRDELKWSQDQASFEMSLTPENQL